MNDLFRNIIIRVIWHYYLTQLPFSKINPMNMKLRVSKQLIRWLKWLHAPLLQNELVYRENHPLINEIEKVLWSQSISFSFVVLSFPKESLEEFYVGSTKWIRFPIFNIEYRYQIQVIDLKISNMSAETRWEHSSHTAKSRFLFLCSL